ncbi:MAG TPA: MFS transporter [Vicinamibacteria bacterium]|nr:MFS transporter [Vicinamibacteria bacterium]
MSDSLDLLRGNRNYRWTWLGQVVSEIGDHFNNVAVLALVLETTGSGMAVSLLMVARAVPAVVAGPAAGVALDRFDRRRIMLASDLVRAVVAFAFVLPAAQRQSALLYALSAALMFASPFFSSGRAAILPTIVSPAELHTANSLTQNTQSATLVLGTVFAGFAAGKLGFVWAFVLNALSFLFSALAVWRLRVPGGFRARRRAAAGVLQPWRDYREGLRYLARTPLLLGIALMAMGWAAGGGAAQILFALFGEQVFRRGPAGIGTIWGFAGIGLLLGGLLGHLLADRLGFAAYKRSVSFSYLSHGISYVLFSLSRDYGAALLWMAASRVGMATTSILNNLQMLRHTADEYRGRVFATIESLRWSTMIVSFAVAGVASQHFSARAIGVVAGLLGALTGLLWAVADWTGRLPEPTGASPNYING